MQIERRASANPEPLMLARWLLFRVFRLYLRLVTGIFFHALRTAGSERQAKAEYQYDSHGKRPYIGK